MASQNQVQEVQQQIEAVVGEVSEVKTSLAAAEEDADGDKVRFLRDRLVQLDRKEVVLREEKNKLMDIQSGGTSDEVLAALVEIRAGQAEINSLLQVHSVLQLDRFMYTEGKITSRTDVGAQLFSRSVKTQYGAVQGSKCWCLLTNAVLPSSTVIGSHLFKWEWSEYVHVLGFENINDVKNGLPLWKPLEWAFDTSRLCFTFDKNSDKFIAKIMDPSILTKRLADIGQEKMGSDWKSPPYPLQKLTFQDIENRPLEFDPGRPLRPYKRVLNFQARQARTYAIRHGWQPASWDFEDYLTEGMDLSEKLKIWYNSMH